MENSSLYSSQDRLKHVQSAGFFVAAGLACIFCGFFAMFGFTSARSSPTIALENRINPNDASSASLMRLPGIGLGRANAIIEYRNRYQQENAGPAFRDCDDLQKVKGIGPATAGDMCEHLMFK